MSQYTHYPLSGANGLSNPVTPAQGGTGITSYTTGDILYASATNVLSKLAIGSNGSVLKVSGGLPSWGTDLNTGITALTGDGTATGPGSAVLTFATVNSNVGSFTNASLTVNAKGLVTAASSGAAPEVPLTFSTGLTRTVNTVTVNTSQNIATLSNLTTNGFVKTGGGAGTLSIDTNTYITGNQTITLSGDVTGSGTTAISTTIANSAITDAKVSASAAIAYSKLNLASSIVNADISASAAIAYSKLNLSSSIVNADVSASAAIAYSKLATMASGSILLGNAGTPTATALSGDVTVGATGVTAIGAGKVTNTMIAASTIDLTAKVTGLLPIANGGTNSSATATAGGVGYGTGSAHAYTGAGTSGQFLKSNGSSAPAFTSFTPPTVQKFAAAPTGATNYTFTVTSANATVGATYTNNGQTFTVLQTLAAGTTLFMSGTGTPAASGTLTKASGTGDSTITFSSFSNAYILPAGALYIRVQMVGGGGGGAGSALTANHDGGGGGSGGQTAFGTSLLTASGGNGGTGGLGGIGTGGTASLGTGPIGFTLTGGAGGGSQLGISGTSLAGGSGGVSAWGGMGGSDGGSGSGTAGVTNTGGGGAGSSAANGRYTGAGGGAGGYVDAIVTSPSAFYSCAVGAGGSAGTAGTSGNTGFAGGSGMIVVWEYYQ